LAPALQIKANIKHVISDTANCALPKLSEARTRLGLSMCLSAMKTIAQQAVEDNFGRRGPTVECED